MWAFEINGLWQNTVHMLLNLHNSQEPHLQTGPGDSFNLYLNSDTQKTLTHLHYSLQMSVIRSDFGTLTTKRL